MSIRRAAKGKCKGISDSRISLYIREIRTDPKQQTRQDAAYGWQKAHHVRTKSCAVNIGMFGCIDAGDCVVKDFM